MTWRRPRRAASGTPARLSGKAWKTIYSRFMPFYQRVCQRKNKRIQRFFRPPRSGKSSASGTDGQVLKFPWCRPSCSGARDNALKWEYSPDGSGGHRSGGRWSVGSRSWYQLTSRALMPMYKDVSGKRVGDRDSAKIRGCFFRPVALGFRFGTGNYELMLTQWRVFAS